MNTSFKLFMLSRKDENWLFIKTCCLNFLSCLKLNFVENITLIFTLTISIEVGNNWKFCSKQLNFILISTVC